VSSKANQRRFGRIYEIGCLACRKRGWFNDCQAHHLNLDGKAGQKRRGDECSIGLCPWHHVGEPIGGMTAAECRRRLGPSLKLESVAFREKFGEDDELLRWQNELIEESESNVVGRRIA
jgi:hypothetical protein